MYSPFKLVQFLERGIEAKVALMPGRLSNHSPIHNRSNNDIFYVFIQARTNGQLLTLRPRVEKLLDRLRCRKRLFTIHKGALDEVLGGNNFHVKQYC